MKNEHCLICGAAVPEGAQICENCAGQFDIKAGEAVEIAEEMRDIAGVLSITANTDGNIKQSMESILRIADRLERKNNGENRAKIFTESGIGKAAHGKKSGGSERTDKRTALHKKRNESNGAVQ